MISMTLGRRPGASGWDAVYAAQWVGSLGAAMRFAVHRLA
jgi:hypothetical protein